MSAVWAYCRVSTRKEEQEDSLDIQLERATTFACERNLQLVVYSEQASAKSITGRPVMLRLLAELEACPVKQRPKIVFVTSLDRLFRNMIDGMYIGKTLRDLKVALIIAGRGEIKLETFAERAMFVGESMGGDAENEGRSKRARDSWARRRNEGKPTSNKVPYGLQLLGERDVPIVDSAPWVRKAFEWYAQGDGTYTIGKRMDGQAPPHTWLTTLLDEDGNRKSKTRDGTRWESLRVVKLLRQKRYRGTIVEPELFDAVQERLNDSPKPGSRRIREYPLSGAMRCDECGRHLHGCSRGSSSRYRLADGTMKIYPREPTRYYVCAVCDYAVNANRVEADFFGNIGDLGADDRLLRRWIAAPRRAMASIDADRREFQLLEADLHVDVLQDRKNRLFELALSVSLNELDFKRQMDRLEAEVAKKRVRLAELRQRLSARSDHAKSLALAKSLLFRFVELYDQAEYELKREILNSLSAALGGLTVSRDGLNWAARPPASERKR